MCYCILRFIAVLSIFSICAIWTVLFLVVIGGSFYQQPTGDGVNVFNLHGSITSLGSM